MTTRPSPTGTPCRNPRPTRGTAALALLATLTMLAACAGTPEPTTEMALAEAAVTRASSQATQEAAGAELRVATDKLAQARSASAAGDQDRARRLAEQAVLDAQVAELHAQSVRSRRAAQETDDAARALREEINRKTAR